MVLRIPSCSKAASPTRSPTRLEVTQYEQGDDTCYYSLFSLIRLPAWGTLLAQTNDVGMQNMQPHASRAEPHSAV